MTSSVHRPQLHPYVPLSPSSSSSSSFLSFYHSPHSQTVFTQRTICFHSPDFAPSSRITLVTSSEQEGMTDDTVIIPSAHLISHNKRDNSRNGKKERMCFSWLDDRTSSATRLRATCMSVCDECSPLGTFTSTSAPSSLFHWEKYLWWYFFLSGSPSSLQLNESYLPRVMMSSLKNLQNSQKDPLKLNFFDIYVLRNFYTRLEPQCWSFMSLNRAVKARTTVPTIFTTVEGRPH